MADDIAKTTALVAAGTLPSSAISMLDDNPFPILAEKGHLS
jgi:histidine ammonia-lyase